MMKKIIHLFFPVIMLSLFSCHDTEAKHEMEEPDFDGFVKISLQSQIFFYITQSVIPGRAAFNFCICNISI